MKSVATRCIVLFVALLTSALAITAFSLPTAQAAQPSDPGPANQLPNAVPSAITPSVNDGRVYAIAENGSNMIIGGSFTQVGGQSHQRVAVFNKTNGALSSTFAPTVNGDVNAVLPGPTTTTVYIGGAFTQVNGVAAQFLALVNTSDGSLVTTFHAPAFNYGFINDLVLRSGRLYVAGTFSTVGGKAHAGLASLNPTTGALDPFINVQFAGHHNDSGTGAQGWVGPWDIDVTPDGATMVVIGNFKTANGLLRDQVAMLDLTGSSAQVAPLGDLAVLAVLLQLGLRQLRARRVLLPRRLLLRHQRHRRRQRHPVRHHRPVRDQRQRHRRAADLGRLRPAGTPSGASR